MYVVNKSCIVPSLVTLLPKILKKVITQLELGLALTCISVENTNERLHEQTLRSFVIPEYDHIIIFFIFVTHMGTNSFHSFKPKNVNYNGIMWMKNPSKKKHFSVKKRRSKYWSNYQQSRKINIYTVKRVNIWANVYWPLPTGCGTAKPGILKRELEQAWLGLISVCPEVVSVPINSTRFLRACWDSSPSSLSNLIDTW